MSPDTKAFIEFLLDHHVLCFGEFTLKSGRVSPYFFNAGRFRSGQALAHLGRCYAKAIEEAGFEYDVLFGPAYKGISLVAATAIALAEQHGKDVPFSFNRKEVKAYGEGGVLIGAPLEGKVLVVDDVISAGTTAKESHEIILAHGAQMAGMVISMDREERGSGSLSAIQEIESDYSIQVASIIRLQDLIDYLEHRGDRAEDLERMQAYQASYGQQ